MATRNLPPRPRGKPSGIPFAASFTDVAAQAGLKYSVICGDSDKPAVNIIETVGCGVALFDYDNDGWLDIFILTGTRLEGAPPEPAIASIRTIAMEPSPTSPNAPDSSAWAGRRP